jgi:hypothetical protein
MSEKIQEVILPLIHVLPGFCNYQAFSFLWPGTPSLYSATKSIAQSRFNSAHPQLTPPLKNIN